MKYHFRITDEDGSFRFLPAHPLEGELIERGYLSAFEAFKERYNWIARVVGESAKINQPELRDVRFNDENELVSALMADGKGTYTPVEFDGGNFAFVVDLERDSDEVTLVKVVD